jgi:plastocyanin
MLPLYGLLLLVALAAGPNGEWSVAPSTHAVAQRGKRFDPVVLYVAVGDSIVFRNDDDVAHNIFSQTVGATFDLRTQKPGVVSGVVVPKAGTIEVRCAFHPTMRMMLRAR